MRIGARTVSGLARLCLIVGAGIVLVSCTGESSASELAPTPASAVTVEVVPTSTPVATSTPRPTATSTPTATATPEPTPTPTGVELYGELLVDGAYTWPVEMPDDLTEDELFAINIFASWQNAQYASYSVDDAASPEIELMRSFVGEELISDHDDALATFKEQGQRGPVPQPANGWIEVEVSYRSPDGLAVTTCEHVDTIVTDLEQGSEQRAFGTSFRRIEYLLEDGKFRLMGWLPEKVELEQFTCSSN